MKPILVLEDIDDELDRMLSGLWASFACSRQPDCSEAQGGEALVPVVAPPQRPKPVTAPAKPGKLYKVVATCRSGPTPSSRQVYINVNLRAEDGTNAHLRFYWNSITQNKEWMILFAVLLEKFGLTEITDTDQMHGCWVRLYMRGRATVAGLHSVAAALGYPIEGPECGCQ